MSETSCRTSSKGLFALGLMLAVGFVLSTHLITRNIEKIHVSNQTVTVKGFAERAITSDWGFWSGIVKTKAPDLVSAYAGLEKQLEKVLAYLQSQGFAKNQVDVSSVTTTLFYKYNDRGNQTNEVDAYQLEQTVSIGSANVSQIDQLSKESTQLIKDGVELISCAPLYYYNKINDLKIEMLGLATKDARSRAEALAQNSGSRIGVLHSGSQGVFQITPRYSTYVSDSGEFDTSAILKNVKAVVTVSYSIQ